MASRKATEGWRLEQWATTNLHPDANPYTAPEQRDLFIHGHLYGDPTFPDGYEVVTSGVRKVKGRMITTKNGSHYTLGTPDPVWLAWLREHGIPFDPERPIRLVR